MAAENNLGKDKVSRLVWRIAIPSMLGQFVSVLYSIVDRMYIGNIPEIGDVALAGVGVCGPVVTMVGSVAVLVGVGGAPLVSIRMGEEDLSAAKKVLANCFLMLIVFSVLLIGGILPFREPMLRLFGASDATYPFAEEYFTAYLCGTFFALAASGLNQFIICQGFAKIGMASVMLGAALNIVLDPVFIFALDMGVRGAAIATVISQAASAAFVIRFLFGKRVQVPITFGGYDVRVMGRVLVMGFTPFLIVAVDNVMIIAMNAILQRTGGADGDMLVTCNTIVQSFMLVVTMPLGASAAAPRGFWASTTAPARWTGCAKPKSTLWACAWATPRCFLCWPGWRGRCLCGCSPRTPCWPKRPSRPLKSAPWPSSPWGCSTSWWTASRALARCG